MSLKMLFYLSEDYFDNILVSFWRRISGTDNRANTIMSSLVMHVIENGIFCIKRRYIHLTKWRPNKKKNSTKNTA